MTVATRVLPFKESDPDGTFDSRYYRKPEVDQKIADATTGEHDHDDRYYTEAESDARFAPITHTHDDRYYTETEINAKLAGPATPSSLSTSGPVQIGTDLTHKGTKAGFYNVTPISKPVVAGGRRGNPALASLLTALASLGLVSNTTTEDPPTAYENASDNTANTTHSGASTVTRNTLAIGPLPSGKTYLVEMEGLAHGEGDLSNAGDAKYTLEIVGGESYTTPESMRFEQGVDSTQSITHKAIVTGTGASLTVNYKTVWAAGDYTIKFSRLVASATPIG